ncbi:transcription factor TFIIIC subunit TFC8 NDAI_0C06210 [Naumovozyma dairenensis CBS 421]|uniref:Transcription factor IIIC putative zinc-finger domain-containing protein n=1 Tax=Naumovozyma dairenensis (strain ATCC 10597 / BCRC 20456 / CBS 421 / NBRC 0211 / NRRL Y-12639) TaxID=1071378 RepID=G0W919_NAUDC|nr:hypothetical protein NDAI_0C06210 [Naumovozyma dairenensis CBS 421]CCD24280.1 hypothetical protein NDAI_0C06210 [Naumovozyma dairenensis CBS 421]
MKTLKDLVINRKEFKPWSENITWATDGTLYLNTYPTITVGQPIFVKDIKGHSKHLFYLEELKVDSEIPNKLEFDIAEENTLLNSQPISYTRSCKPSPNCHDVFAVLTTNGNVLVCDKGKWGCYLDTPDTTHGLASRIYHSMEWSPDGHYLLAGNELGQLVVFKENTQADGIVSFEYNCIISLLPLIDQNLWVTNIKWTEDDTIIAILDDNSMFAITWDYSNIQKNTVMQLMASSRFKIVDFQKIKDYVVVTSSGYFHKINLIKNETSSLEIGPNDGYKIIPLGKTSDEVILLSNKTSCKLNLNEELNLLVDDVISPLLEKSVKKWNAVWNEYNKYETTLFIYGVAVSPDGYSLAILYDIEKISMKYRITSQLQYNIMFIPLNTSWELSNQATGFAKYQTYNIYDKMLPTNGELNLAKINEYRPNFDTNIDFKSYLQLILKDKVINNLLFLNFIGETTSIYLIRKLIYQYGLGHQNELVNEIDKAAFQSLSCVLEEASSINVDQVTIKGDYIEETFGFKDSTNTIISNDGNTWNRCAATLLPLLTTKVKICLVTKTRVIDITRDTQNEYGWFTKTLLEVFGDTSIYCGSKMKSS